MRIMRLKSLAVAALALAACGVKSDIDATKYTDDQCRRLAITDHTTGEMLVGAEDFAVDWDAGRLFFTAYDRRAVEKAARKKAAHLPQGGVYAASLAQLFSPESRSVSLESLASPGDFKGGLHPHGLAYDNANRELVFINRTYERDGRKWMMTPRLQRIGANGEVFVSEPEKTHCAANDVALAGGELYTTFDHASCNWRAAIEDIFRTKNSGLTDEAGDPVFRKAAFANGLAKAGSGALVLAATRENALLLIGDADGKLETMRRIALPGGPDNLTVTEDGDIIAAVHPKMFRLALNRKLGIGKSPSRIVRVNPRTGAADILFDDPKGALFSAATVALETEDGLIAGSVTDDGFLVCRAQP